MRTRPSTAATAGSVPAPGSAAGCGTSSPDPVVPASVVLARSTRCRGSWPLRSEQHDVGEQRAGAAARAHARPRRPRPAWWRRSPRSCSTPRITRWSSCTVAPPWLNDISPPSVVTGNRPPGPMVPSITKSPPSPGAAELERLELADDLERERVVELAHVDVVGVEARRRERAARGAAADEAVGDVVGVATGDVPRGRVPVRRADAVDDAAEHVHRLVRQVGARGRRGPARSPSRLPTSSRSRAGGTDRRPCATRGCRRR